MITEHKFVTSRCVGAAFKIYSRFYRSGARNEAAKKWGCGGAEVAIGSLEVAADPGNVERRRGIYLSQEHQICTFCSIMIVLQ
jgi:hypothetical protein